MKRKLMIIAMIAFLIIANSIIVYAGANSVTLTAEKTEVKAGENFTVKIKATAPDGINGMVTTFSYDTEKLELVSKDVSDENFSKLSGKTANEIVIIFDPEDVSNFTKVTETDIYEFTFKVKEGVAEGSTATISLGETTLSTLGTTTSEYKLPEEEIVITVAKETTENPDDGNQGTGDNEQKPDDGNQGTEDDEDDTVADGDINYAGLENYALIIVAIAVIAVALYKKSNQYKDIK